MADRTNYGHLQLQLIKKYLVDFWYERPHVLSDPWKKLIPRILLFVLLFVVVDRLFYRAARLPVEAYDKDFIYWQFLKKVGSKLFLIIPALLTLLYFNKKLFFSWNSLEHGRKVSFLLGICALVLTWNYTTYDYNHFFGQWHYLDRSLLLFTAMLIFWRPVFVIVFLSVLLPIIGQFEILPGYSLAAPRLLLQILLLFVVFYGVKLVARFFYFKDFAFLVGCVMATNYFASGIRKFSLDWILYDQVNYFLPNSYAVGWLSFLSADKLSSLTASLEWLNIPMKIFTLGFECGIVLLFLRLKWARILIIGLIAMHLGIIAFTGIFFWMWLSVLVVILVFLFKKDVFQQAALFNKKYFLISLVLIGLGEFWAKPIALAWYDVPYSYSYKFEAEMEDGKSYALPPNFFSPYDYQFTMTNFKYLSSEKLLPITFGGSSSKKISGFFREEPPKDEVFLFEDERGRAYRNIKQEESLYDFLRQYVKHWNARSGDPNPVDYIQPPRLLLTYPTRTIPSGKHKIVRLNIYESTTYYRKDIGFEVVRKRKVGSVLIP